MQLPVLTFYWRMEQASGPFVFIALSFRITAAVKVGLTEP